MGPRSLTWTIKLGLTGMYIPKVSVENNLCILVYIYSLSSSSLSLSATLNSYLCGIFATVYVPTCFINCQSTNIKVSSPLFFPPKVVLTLSVNDYHMSLLQFSPMRNCCLVTQNSSNESDTCLFLTTVTHLPNSNGTADWAMIQCACHCWLM